MLSVTLITCPMVSGKLDLSNIGECDGKVVMKAERLCKYGIDPDSEFSRGLRANDQEALKQTENVFSVPQLPLSI